MPKPEIVTRGAVVRGTSSATSCSFLKEEVDIHGRLTDASVNCGADRDTAVRELPGRFTHVGETTAERIVQKQGRILRAPMPDNPEHCLLSGITLKDAQNLFSHVTLR